jgi:S1-C subfamily serine protease
MKWFFLSSVFWVATVSQAQVVKVVCTAPDGGVMQGTGVIALSKDAGGKRYVNIVTAEHVVATAGKVVVIVDGVKIPCSITRTSHDLDLALLHISDCPIPVKEVAMAERAFRHDRVTAKNYDGKTVSGKILEVGTRELTVLEGVRLKGRLLETDAPLTKGFSGGPIFNENGEMVGMSLAAGGNSYGVDVMEIRGFLIAALQADIERLDGELKRREKDRGK